MKSVLDGSTKEAAPDYGATGYRYKHLGVRGKYALKQKNSSKIVIKNT